MNTRDNSKILGFFGDLFSDSHGMTTYTGVVRYAFPWLNLYVVEPISNGVLAKKLELVSGGDGSSVSGSVYVTYSINDIVMVASDRNEHGSMSVTDYIIGLASVQTNTGNSRPMNSCTNVRGFSDILTKVFDKVKVVAGVLGINVEKAFTQPTDLLSGDTNITSSPNVGISVLKHIVKIQCGKGCFVELDSVLSRIRVVTSSVEFIGPLYHHQDLSGKGSLLEYKQTAISPEEGLRGIVTGTEEDTPLFRKKEVAGDVTLGWEESVAVPNTSAGTSDDVYLSKVRYDGEATMASAKGFEIKKTLNIVTPYIKPGTEDPTRPYTEVDIFPDMVNNLSKGDYEYLLNRSLNMASEAKERVDSDFPRVACNKDKWGLSTDVKSQEVSDTIQKDGIASLDSIGSSQYYDLPDTLDIKDPHTGLVYKYFKSDSGIRWESDGSLVLYDGYGSEIRMTRGSIIISSATDTIIRPGRDTHVMSGRHTALVSQKDVTLHSSTSDVNIKGHGIVQVLSGLDKEGGFILDDRGSGILIKSKDKASVVAKDIFVGSVPETKESISVGASKGSGTVTIGGGANTVITGDAVAVYGKSADIIGKNEDRVSWVSVGDGSVTTISEKISMEGGVHIGQLSGALSSDIGSEHIISRSSRPSLSVDAEVRVAYSILCRDLWAENIRAEWLNAGNASRESGVKARVSAPNITIEPRTVSQPSRVLVTYGGPWSDAFNMAKEFKYKDSGDIGISPTYTVPGMLWQIRLDGDKLWNEPEIPSNINSDITCMVYPGKAAWSNGTVTLGPKGSKSIIGGYIING